MRGNLGYFLAAKLLGWVVDSRVFLADGIDA